jgi:diketogulonate reductase-like aldo/keto reductase
MISFGANFANVKHKTWLEMENLTKPDPKTGVIKSRKIGISNFNVTQLEDLLAHANIKPYLHQIETHPYLQQQSFIDLHVKHGIKVTAYAPFGNTNPEYAYRQAITGKMLQDPTLVSIAKARNCASPAQVALSWNVARGVSVVPKSQHTARQIENYNALRQCKLTAADMAAIKAVDRKARYWDMCCAMGLPCFLGQDGACATTPVAADYCQIATKNVQTAKAPYFALDVKATDKSCPKLP